MSRRRNWNPGCPGSKSSETACVRPRPPQLHPWRAGHCSDWLWRKWPQLCSRNWRRWISDCSGPSTSSPMQSVWLPTLLCFAVLSCEIDFTTIACGSFTIRKCPWRRTKFASALALLHSDTVYCSSSATSSIPPACSLPASSISPPLLLLNKHNSRTESRESGVKANFRCHFTNTDGCFLWEQKRLKPLWVPGGRGSIDFVHPTPPISDEWIFLIPRDS